MSSAGWYMNKSGFGEESGGFDQFICNKWRGLNTKDTGQEELLMELMGEVKMEI